jgi:capsular polysaccharide biosynthesis protein
VDRRIAESRREVERLRARLGQVEQRIAAFQTRVEVAPRREQEILGLMRDYKKLNDNYSQLLDKKLDAELASRLEAQQKGQQFRVLDPAYMPETPSFPNRVLFAIGGAVAGLLLGLGLAITIDVLDPTMKDAEGVAAAFTVPVLAVIPFVKPRDQARLASLPIDGSPAAHKRKRGLLSYGRSASRKSAAGPK